MPRAKNLACNLALTKTGWLSCRGATSSSTDDEDYEKEEEVYEIVAP